MSNMTKQYKHTIKYLVESKKKKKVFHIGKMLAAIDKFLCDFYWLVFLFSYELQHRKNNTISFSLL